MVSRRVASAATGALALTGRRIRCEPTQIIKAGGRGSRLHAWRFSPESVQAWWIVGRAGATLIYSARATRLSNCAASVEPIRAAVAVSPSDTVASTRSKKPAPTSCW